MAYLEQIRAERRKRYVIVVQSLVRRYVYQKRYKMTRAAVLGIQRYARGMLARRRVQVVREERAAVVIQRHVRGWLQRTHYQRTRSCIARLQARCRGYLIRQRFTVVLDNYKATHIQRYCRGYLARKRFAVRLQQIVKCQAAVRRFLARRRYKKLRAEARTVAGMQKKYLGLENKIISLQQSLDEYRKENKTLKRTVEEIPELRTRVEQVKRLENELKPLKVDLQSQAERIITLEQKLTLERDEKMQLVHERDREQKEWQAERVDLLENLAELEKTILVVQATADAAAEENRRVASFEPVSELTEVYQRAVNEKEVLETENTQLRDEVRRLQFQLNNHSSLNYSSHESTNTSGNHEEDVGYSSAKNTLELRPRERNTHAATPSPAPRNTNSTATLLRLRKLLEEEKRTSEQLQGKLDRYESLKRPYNQSLSPEDRIRLAELEVEYERLAKDYESLRMGIARGVETKVLDDQYVALQDELRRRKDESVQLKTVLAEQSQSMRSLNDNASMLDRFQDYTELLEAFQAQKLVNRQLESELTAITEEHNVALREFSRQLDELSTEKGELLEILSTEMQKGEMDDANPMTVNYLRMELERVTADYVQCHEEMIELKRMNQIFIDRLRDHGLNDSILLDENVDTMALVNRKPLSYQGIFKYLHEDEGKIIQRLVIDYTPQVAITLQPGLPAYIFLMCVRYTDLMNADQYVRTLLSNIVTQVKKLFALPKSMETRLVWLVNMLKLFNLLRQYGGLEEYAQLNTETQNRQQLKNFDLTEYRRIIREKILYFYQLFVLQVEYSIKQLVVPALLEYDETTRGKKSARKSVDAEQVMDPASLVHRLNQLYEQFQHFGLSKAYTVQIFYQLFYYISAVALNNLMLRSDLCTWRTGMKIRYNTGLLKSWASEVGMPAEVLAKLDVLMEVSGLLQLRKSDAVTDVKSIVDMCQLLSATQILKIIKMYRSDDAEPQVTQAFIEALTRTLTTDDTNDSFMVDENYMRPISVNYEHSEVRLEEIELPAVLNLRGVLTKI